MCLGKNRFHNLKPPPCHYVTEIILLCLSFYLELMMGSRCSCLETTHALGLSVLLRLRRCIPTSSTSQDNIQMGQPQTRSLVSLPVDTGEPKVRLSPPSTVSLVLRRGEGSPPSMCCPCSNVLGNFEILTINMLNKVLGFVELKTHTYSFVCKSVDLLCVMFDYPLY